MILLAVPNISEGRDPDLVREIAGDSVLDVHIDPDHNRSVLTYGGHASDIETQCNAMIERAVRMLDITKHDGVHPRFGVVDVLPIVPYDAPRKLAESVADRIARHAQVPVYRYTDDLPDLRRGLRAPHDVHATAGVLCIGVRGPLIAFNVNIRGTAYEARNIVRQLRNLDGIRALAFELPSRGIVQISMNLTRPDRVGPRFAYDAVAARTTIQDAEVVGLVPQVNARELDDIPLRRPARTIEEVVTGDVQP